MMSVSTATSMDAQRALFRGIGLCYWRRCSRRHTALRAMVTQAARDLAARMSWVPYLAGAFFAGGVGRAISYAAVGAPHPFFLLLMGLELAIPPVLMALWFASRTPR